ncbi:MAG: MMPL family transporter [Myxococcales bacterium]|nr:MMPL family transporter [Myxococcota bacterium]MDW8280761.1 MMPL family transporter [Myxococcales bacterium]
MSKQAPGFLHRCFRTIVALRFWVLGFWGALLGPAIYYCFRVEQDNSIHRLIVRSDPDYVASEAFEKVFGKGEYVVLLAEAEDPFDPRVLAKVDQMERALSALSPRIEGSSALTVYRRARAGFSPTPEQAADFRSFVTGTPLFREQGLYGDHFLALPLVLSVHGTRERAELLAAIDAALKPVEQDLHPIRALRKIGQPYVNDYLDRDTRTQGPRYFLLFGLFVLVLNISLYRSVRALLAFVLTLGASAALSVGYVGLTGGTFTIVSSLVPMTVLITCTANLVYIHSRFVECPDGRSADEHQIDALVNKFVACTASIFATAVGFAALAVSKIRPIREMGIWVAVGLVFTWLLVFTLFPALQRVLRTPTRQERAVAGRWFTHFTHWLPGFSYRWRWVLVPGSLVLCALGAVALLGLPGVLPHMELQTNAIEYIPRHSTLYRDTKRLEQAIAGLSMTNLWLRGGKLGSIVDPSVLRALARLEEDLKQEPLIGTAVGLPSVLRSMRYAAGKGDRLPEDDEALERVTDTLESLLAREPLLRRYVDGSNLSQTHMAIITKTLDYDGFVRLKEAILRRVEQARQRDPALAQFQVEIVGLAALEAKISYHLVPTLVESFVLTVVIIFCAFLVLFRNGAARLMAMIPSLFAILVMFLVMRLLGMNLNVATILIASTVLGTSENDQIHFFYHFLEKRGQATTEQCLQHTLMIAGRAIFFATLINAGGFLAFGLAELPPIRQFGVLAALAFILSMLADFSALPAALWMVFRDRPDALQPKRGPAR